MTEAEIKHTQRRVGTDDDGDWGPKSTAAAKRHLRAIMKKEGALRRFPTQRQVRSGKSVYGPVGVKDGYTPPMKKIKLPFPLRLYKPDGQRKLVISAHEKCADSLLAVHQRIGQLPKELLERSRFQLWFGIYNPRNSRGGSLPSMHSWAIASDNDAGRNRNRSHWPVASKMPVEIYECFAAEGWLSAGVFWSRDGMHNQAASE